MTEPAPIAPAAHLHGVIEISPLSRVVSQNGITLQLTIYRREATPPWSFTTINPTATKMHWTEDFYTDADALRAFEVDIEAHGIESYLDGAPTTCPLCRAQGR
jgi:hypothetical protein